MNLLQTSTSELQNMNKLLQSGVGIVISLLLAPIIEEMVFRAIILSGLVNHYSKKIAVLVSVVLFSIYHFNLLQLLPSFLVGLLLGYIYLETRSVLICIYTHVIYNLIPVVINQFQSTSGEVPKIASKDYIITVISLFVLLAGIKLLHNYFQTNYNAQVISEENNLEQEEC